MQEFNQSIIGKAGLIPKAGKLFSSESVELKQKAVMLFTNLCCCGILFLIFFWHFTNDFFQYIRGTVPSTREQSDIKICL